MQRITVTINDELLAGIDKVMAERGYQSRSEAIRDLTRADMTQMGETTSGEHSVSPRWSMCTTTRVASWRSGSRDHFTTITISRWRRCMFISTTRVAWRSRCSEARCATSVTLPSTSSPSAASVTAGLSRYLLKWKPSGMPMAQHAVIDTCIPTFAGLDDVSVLMIGLRLTTSSVGSADGIDS